MTTPHNAAQKGDIASIVLMPGDPLRAEYIAKTYLDHPVQFNTIRNMYGYTGEYQGTRISVMGSGMGMPSIGIYSYELYKFYDVDTIIRIGSAGAYTTELHLFDIVLASSAWSESTFALAQANVSGDTQYPHAAVNDVLEDAAADLQIPITKARIHSSDVFYHEDHVANHEDFYQKHQCVCVEMESFALFHNAHILGKKAACLLTISDSLLTHAATTAKQRETSFQKMMEVALAGACKLNQK